MVCIWSVNIYDLVIDKQVRCMVPLILNKNVFFLLLWALCVPTKAYAIDGNKAFELHNMVMLLIQPKDGQIIKANPAAAQFYGYSISQLESMTIQDINTLSREATIAEMQLAKTEKRSYFIFEHRLSNGDFKTVEVSSIPMIYKGKKVLYSIIRDISEYRAAQEGLWHYQHRLEDMVKEQSAKVTASHRLQLFTFVGLSTFLAFVLVALAKQVFVQRKTKLLLEIEKNRLSDFIWASNIGTWEWELKTDRMSFNDFAYSLVGYEKWIPFTVKRDKLELLSNPEDWQTLQSNMAAMLRGDLDFYEAEVRVKHSQGHWVWILARGKVIQRSKLNGEPLTVAGTYQDITIQKDLNQCLYDSAHLDALTEIPNRRAFVQYLERLDNSPHVLFYMDLNRFKYVNDEYGHQAGDIVLQTVAKRLQSLTRRSDHVFRLSGDEFAVIINGSNCLDNAHSIASKLLQGLSQPHLLDDNSEVREVVVPPSIGVSFYPSVAGNTDALVRQADQMMYRAKENNPNGGYEIYQAE